MGFAAVRQRRVDALGDLVAAHLDTLALPQFVDEGPAWAGAGRPCMRGPR
ncbi:MAG: hypothetical protein ACXV3A_03535 [Kineosporiaceae bacterium]